MRNKKVVSFLIVMFLLMVLVLPTACAFMPYRKPYFSETTDVYFDIDVYKVEVYADLKNATLVINGKPYKELKVKRRQERSLVNLRSRANFL
ncbi:MAG: hypothetical protein E7379_01025 [Clostridiales bacterium]|nr:hypothetical protein [Clostridiales bacterium]